MASKEKRVGQKPRDTPGETTPTSLTASSSRAPQSEPTSTRRRLRAPATSVSEHNDSGSRNSEYEDPDLITFRETETLREVENNPPEPEEIKTDSPSPESPKISYFPASYLHRTKPGTSHSSTSTPTTANLPPPPVTAMATSTELKGLGKLDPFRGNPSNLDSTSMTAIYSWMSMKRVTILKRRKSFSCSHI